MKGFVITESEKRQIRSLYSNKGLISEQGEDKSGSTKSTECVPIEVIGTFDAMVTEDKTNMLNFINKLNEQINKNETLKLAKEEGSLYISKITLIGGASNRYGGKVVKPTMDNNYNPKTYSEDAKYTGDFDANLQLAEDRAKNVWTELQEFLPKNNITIGTGVVPTVKKYVIDTNGAIDKTNKSVIDSGEFNAGQIVKMSIDLCGSKGSTDIKECFEKAIIEVHFEGDKVGNKKHDCNKAVYEIYANGVKLTSTSGHDYASLNNLGDNKFPADKADGRFRYNYFEITADGVNNEFLNGGAWNKYDGKLLITAKCINHGLPPWGRGEDGKIKDCHQWVGDIKFSSQSVGETEIKPVGPESQPTIPGVTLSTPDNFDVPADVVTFEACKGLKQK